MRVHVHPADQGACGHFRMILPGEQAGLEPGVDVRIVDTRAEDHYQMLVAGEGRLARPVKVADGQELPDVIVLQRPLWQGYLELIDLFQRRGTAVVVEVDDDFHAVPRDNVAWVDSQPRWFTASEVAALREAGHDVRADAEGIHPVWRTPVYRVEGRTSARSKAWLAKACRAADLVVVSTPALAERYGRHREPATTVVLENMVPESWTWDLGTRQPGVVRVGWPGTLRTHAGDLDVVGSGVADALAIVGRARFATIGSTEGDHAVARVLGLDPATVDFVPYVDDLRGAYPETVASLDVGIAPLADHRFNRAKSWLKALEYSALGVAWVASPMPEYRRLAEAGAGALASTPAGWREHLVRLLDDDAARAEQVEANRQVVADLTYEAQGWRWAEVWAEALERRRAAHRAVGRLAA